MGPGEGRVRHGRWDYVFLICLMGRSIKKRKIESFFLFLGRKRVFFRTFYFPLSLAHSLSLPLLPPPQKQRQKTTTQHNKNRGRRRPRPGISGTRPAARRADHLRVRGRGPRLRRAPHDGAEAGRVRGQGVHRAGREGRLVVVSGEREREERGATVWERRK